MIQRGRPAFLSACEARIISGDRIVFRVEHGTIYFVDVVKHDDIARYGRRPRQVG